MDRACRVGGRIESPFRRGAAIRRGRAAQRKHRCECGAARPCADRPPFVARRHSPRVCTRRGPWGVRLATPRSASASPERACLRSKQLAAGGRDENHGRVPRRPPRFPEGQRTIPRYPAGGRRRLPQAPAEPRKATVGKPCSPPLIPARPRPDRKRQDLGMMLGFVSFPNGRKYMGNRDQLLWSPVNPAA
jgi:hypothetical protein